jgi:hypothetical protein
MKGVYYLLLAILFCLTSCDFAPGSYPYAEIYEFDAKEDELIKIVSEFKKSNPNFILPEDINIKDGRSNDVSDHWYHIWFYYKEEDKIVYTWIRGSKFAFVSINEGSELGNWKRINKDFTQVENKKEKEKFEKLILNKIKDKVKYTGK